MKPSNLATKLHKLLFSGSATLKIQKDYLSKFNISTIKNLSFVRLYLFDKHNIFDFLQVNLDEEVKIGQIIAQNLVKQTFLRSSISGRVSLITDEYIEITNDFKNQIELMDSFDLTKFNYDDFILRVKQAGIIGLGGAGFPSYIKLKKAKFLIVNAMECEPHISADEAVIVNYAYQFIAGIELLLKACDIESCFIAIEEHSKRAIEKIKSQLNSKVNSKIKLKIYPTVYPGGSDKQLIKQIFNIEIPFNKYSSDYGILCFNVNTIWAIYQAFYQNVPLVSRFTTITGNNFGNYLNVKIPFGASIKEILQEVNPNNKTIKNVLVGGAMMGYEIKPEVTYFKAFYNGILLNLVNDNIEQLNCINCDACMFACPIRLMPQKLYLFSKLNNYSKMAEYSIESCIECNLCNYVCPSNIDLVAKFKEAKLELARLNKQNQLAKFYKSRNQQKLKLIEQKKLIQQEKIKKLKQAQQEKLVIANEKKKQVSSLMIQINKLKIALKKFENTDKSNKKILIKKLQNLEEKLNLLNNN